MRWVWKTTAYSLQVLVTKSFQDENYLLGIITFEFELAVCAAVAFSISLFWNMICDYIEFAQTVAWSLVSPRMFSRIKMILVS